MTELKTRPTLIKALEKASMLQLGAAELHRQRVSFVMGALKEDSGITRSRVEEVLAKQDGRKPA